MSGDPVLRDPESFRQKVIFRFNTFPNCTSNLIHSQIVLLIESIHCACWETWSSDTKELNNALGHAYLKEEIYIFFLYTMPKRRMKDRNPNFLLVKHMYLQVYQQMCH